MGDKIPLVLSPPHTPLLGVVSNFPRRFLVLNRWVGTCYLQKQDNFFAQSNIKNSPFPIFLRNWFVHQTSPHKKITEYFLLLLTLLGTLARR